MVNIKMVGSIELAKSEPIKVRGKETYYGNDNIVLDFKVGNYNGYGYIWLWVMGVNGDNYYGRDIDDLYTMLNKIKDAAKPNATYVIWVRDLNMFYQFSKNYFVFDKVFARDRNDVLNCWADIFEFRNFKEIINKDERIERQEDLIEKIYSPTTPLTEEELQDFGRTANFMWNWIKNNRTDKLFLLENFNYSFSHCCEKKFSSLIEDRFFVRKRLEDLVPNLDVYDLLMMDNKAGIQWSNFYYNNTRVENVYSYDKSSSYLSMMLTKKYPMGKFFEHKGANISTVFSLLNKRAFIGGFIIKGLKKHTVFNWLTTKSNTIVQADGYTRIVLNDVEFIDLLRNYEIEDISVVWLYSCKYEYLPPQIKKVIMKLYINKTKFKGVDEIKYKEAKVLLNNIFGRCIQPAFYDSVSKIDADKQINMYNIYYTREEKEDLIRKKYLKKLLLPQWGIWTAAYGRSELLRICNELGEMNVVYCDTDGIKFLGEQNKEIFNKANSIIKEELAAAKIDCTVKDKFGKEHTIGLWEFEGNYKNFKTIGSKQYMWDNGDEYDIKLAGANKKGVRAYFDTIAAKERINVFSNDMEIPREYKPFISRRYVDLGKEEEFEIIDYLGLSHVESLRYMVKEDYKGYSVQEVMYKLTNGIYKFN